jgi:hypothetical protein
MGTPKTRAGPYLQRELKYEYTMELSQAPAKSGMPRMGGPF